MSRRLTLTICTLYLLATAVCLLVTMLTGRMP